MIFRSVLCPVDFSAPSRAALRHAARLTRQTRGRLSVLYVNDAFLMAAAEVALHDRTMAARNRDELRRFVHDCVPAAVRRAIPITCLVSTGNPAEEIARAAVKLGSDVIVMGTMGLTGAKKLLIGSTTQGVLHRARVPVLAIPQRAARRSR